MKNNVGTWQKADASNPHSDASNKQHVTNILSECLFFTNGIDGILPKPQGDQGVTWGW